MRFTLKKKFWCVYQSCTSLLWKLDHMIIFWNGGEGLKLSSMLLLLTDVQMFSTKAWRGSLACVTMLMKETFSGNAVCV